MVFIPTGLTGSYEIQPAPFTDDRGWFFRSYCKKEFESIGHNKEWVQMNHSHTIRKGTIRGMHYQKPPYAEIKLVRCVVGSVFDVIIDLRESSPSFLQWIGVELSAQNKKMIYIPEGFAHGFQTLENNTELVYCHSSFYTPGVEGAVSYNDPMVNIQWPLEVTDLSDKDARVSLLDKKFNGIKLN
jgi:dTDP-4-dehydrorhamnose 3,5-epimerase